MNNIIYLIAAFFVTALGVYIAEPVLVLFGLVAIGLIAFYANYKLKDDQGVPLVKLGPEPDNTVVPSQTVVVEPEVKEVVVVTPPIVEEVKAQPQTQEVMVPPLPEVEAKKPPVKKNKPNKPVPVITTKPLRTQPPAPVKEPGKRGRKPKNKK